MKLCRGEKGTAWVVPAVAQVSLTHFDNSHFVWIRNRNWVELNWIEHPNLLDYAISDFNYKNMKLNMNTGEHIWCQEAETSLTSDNDKWKTEFERETALITEPAWAEDVMQHSNKAILFC